MNQYKVTITVEPDPSMTPHEAFEEAALFAQRLNALINRLEEEMGVSVEEDDGEEEPENASTPSWEAI